METGISIVACSILAVVAGIHVYWAFGGRWGIEAALPRLRGGGAHAFTPGPAPTLVVAILVAAAGCLLAHQAGLLALGLPDRWTTLGVRICAAVFALRAIGDFTYFGFAKRVHGTKFARWDTAFFSPLCVFLAISFGVSARLSELF